MALRVLLCVLFFEGAEFCSEIGRIFAIEIGKLFCGIGANFAYVHVIDGLCSQFMLCHRCILSC